MTTSRLLLVELLAPMVIDSRPARRCAAASDSLCRDVRQQLPSVQVPSQAQVVSASQFKPEALSILRT